MGEIFITIDVVKFNCNCNGNCNPFVLIDEIDNHFSVVEMW